MSAQKKCGPEGITQRLEGAGPLKVDWGNFGDRSVGEFDKPAIPSVAASKTQTLLASSY